MFVIFIIYLSHYMVRSQGTIPWRGEWLSTPVCLPGEFHGQKSLASYRPWGCKESDRLSD